MVQVSPANEAAALATAHRWIARGQERSERNDPFFLGYAPLDPEFALVCARREIKRYAQFHVLKMSEVCTWARSGWGEADLALRELIAEFTDRGERLPAPLAAYNMELIQPNRLPPHRFKGRKTAKNLFQDIIIACLVGELVGRHGLAPTRRQSSRPSACSVVAKALGDAGLHRGGEKSVEKIWQRLWPVIGDYRRAASVRN